MIELQDPVSTMFKGGSLTTLTQSLFEPANSLFDCLFKRLFDGRDAHVRSHSISTCRSYRIICLDKECKENEILPTSVVSEFVFDKIQLPLTSGKHSFGLIAKLSKRKVIYRDCVSTSLTNAHHGPYI